MTTRIATILSIDDNADDVTLLRLACGEANVSFQLRAVETGEDAITYLKNTRATTDHEGFPVPDLILLDLKMPGKSGFDVLEWVRAQPDFQHLPVLILTSSIHPEDRMRALSLGADQLLVKSVDFDRLLRMMLALDRLLGSNAGLEGDRQRFGIDAGGDLAEFR